MKILKKQFLNTTNSLILLSFVLIVFSACASGPEYFGEQDYNGKGTWTFPDGTKYVGQWKAGNMVGKGTLTFPDGTKYVGRFFGSGLGINPKKNYSMYLYSYYMDEDQGTLIDSDGKNFNGQKTFTWPDGRKYVCQFENGNMQRQRTLTWPDGTKYVGQFSRCIIYGQGTMTWSNGAKYVGQFQDGKAYGQGTYTWPNGTKYVGQFKDDKMHGQGTLYDSKGKISQNGDFYYGRFVSAEDLAKIEAAERETNKAIGEMKRKERMHNDSIRREQNRQDEQRRQAEQRRQQYAPYK